ncbi:MAG: hypothetical protein JO182_32955 [Acidobacteriaceae bacterium]|nr:hypothetical protein [Acidobacteriaceae bacterium]MBV9305951.1 hypothetical protein [Acidobacteriaceae bacterium]
MNLLNFMKFKRTFWMLAAASVTLTVGNAREACSNATLRGRYAFVITGQILAPPPAAGPVTGVALAEFFGNGTLKQVDHVVHNGVLPAEDWRPAQGSYSINEDCTGWMTISPEPTNPADNGPELKLFIVVTEDGQEIRTVVSGSPNTPPFQANITSTAVRISPLERCSR